MESMTTPHVSYSQYSDYTRCGKAYQLKRLQGAPEKPSVWLVAGKALHTAIERINHDIYARRNA